MIGMADKVLWNRDIIASWKRAYSDSGSSNPFSRKCLERLADDGITMVDIRTRLGHILSREPKKRHPDEVELVEFYENLKLEFEQGLVDNCMESAQGSMFLLKTRYHYREGQDINLTAGNEAAKKVVRSWGVDASAEKDTEGTSGEGSEVRLSEP
jgi:hypothetical protein